MSWGLCRVWQRALLHPIQFTHFRSHPVRRPTAPAPLLSLKYRTPLGLLDYLCLVLCTTIQGNWIGSFFVYRVDFTALKGRRNKINVDINVQLALQLCDLVFEPFPGRNNWLKCDTWLWKIWCVYIPVCSACMLEREREHEPSHMFITAKRYFKSWPKY